MATITSRMRNVLAVESSPEVAHFVTAALTPLRFDTAQLKLSRCYFGIGGCGDPILAQTRLEWYEQRAPDGRTWSPSRLTSSAADRRISGGWSQEVLDDLSNLADLAAGCFSGLSDPAGDDLVFRTQCLCAMFVRGNQVSMISGK